MFHYSVGHLVSCFDSVGAWCEKPVLEDRLESFQLRRLFLCVCVHVFSCKRSGSSVTRTLEQLLSCCIPYFFSVDTVFWQRGSLDTSGNSKEMSGRNWKVGAESDGIVLRGKLYTFAAVMNMITVIMDAILLPVGWEIQTVSLFLRRNFVSLPYFDVDKLPVKFGAFWYWQIACKIWGTSPLGSDNTVFLGQVFRLHCATECRQSWVL